MSLPISRRHTLGVGFDVVTRSMLKTHVFYFEGVERKLCVIHLRKSDWGPAALPRCNQTQSAGDSSLRAGRWLRWSGPQLGKGSEYFYCVCAGTRSARGGTSLTKSSSMDSRIRSPSLCFISSPSSSSYRRCCGHGESPKQNCRAGTTGGTFCL